MSPNIPINYTAEQDDLYNPGRRDEFFASGRPKSDATLCAEMARLAYCRSEPDFSFDQSRIQNILGRAQFVCRRFVESPGQERGKGVHAFVALGDDLQPGVGKLAVVAFRGTDAKDPSDVAYDIDFRLAPWLEEARVHEGFDHAITPLKERVLAELQAIGNCRRLYTGHSLGAAMATLLASIEAPNALYTFGSPRVGDAAFVASMQGVNSFRYVDCCDLVARLPLEKMGFHHIGKPYYIDRGRKITFAPDDGFMHDDRVQAEIDYLEKHAWRLGNVAVRDLADHAPMNYVWPVRGDQG